jgi:hypothetical protein
VIQPPEYQLTHRQNFLTTSWGKFMEKHEGFTTHPYEKPGLCSEENMETT